MDYKFECERLEARIFCLERQEERMKCKLDNLKLTIAELNGKIKAYEFAISKGSVDNG